MANKRIESSKKPTTWKNHWGKEISGEGALCLQRINTSDKSTGKEEATIRKGP